MLAYPKFKLTRDEQEALLAEFLPYVEAVQIDTMPQGLPDIRDADDTIFLVLAAVERPTRWSAAMGIFRQSRRSSTFPSSPLLSLPTGYRHTGDFAPSPAHNGTIAPCIPTPL